MSQARGEKHWRLYGKGGGGAQAPKADELPLQSALDRNHTLSLSLSCPLLSLRGIVEISLREERFLLALYGDLIS